MGWWQQNKQGHSFSANEDGPEMMWGDGPADALDHAIDLIVVEFQKALNRKPTKDEMRAGLEFSLGGGEGVGRIGHIEEVFEEEETIYDRINDALRPLARNDKTARDVYSALCNVAWVPVDHPAQTYGEARGMGALAWTWRAAGGYVADLREKGENYLDFYCSGSEGQVSDAVQYAMALVGYRPVTAKGEGA